MASGLADIDTWITKATGVSSQVPAIEVLVSRTFPRFSDTLPVDLRVYARHAGCRLFFKDVPAARLTFSDLGPEIWIPSSQPPLRQRWSVAHELGHMLFLHHENGVVRPVVPREQTESAAVNRDRPLDRLESLCNIAARVLLVPETQLARIWTASSLRLTALMDAAKDFAVTPSVLFQRLVDRRLLPRRTKHVLLEFRENRWNGRDPKWRIAAHSLDAAEAQRFDFWENRGIDRYGIHLPPPRSGVPASEGDCELRGAKHSLRIRAGDGSAQWIVGELHERTGQQTLFRF